MSTSFLKVFITSFYKVSNALLSFSFYLHNLTTVFNCYTYIIKGSF